MKRVEVPVGKEIKFQGFAFHTLFVRNILDRNVPKVGLTGHGAEAGELGTV